MRLVIIDYSMGNIQSVLGTLKFLNVDNVIVSHLPSDIEKADKLILPGVGSFAAAMQTIKYLEIDKCLKDVVMGDGKSILGICLGMQLMCESSEEDGFSKGLSFVPGHIKRFKGRQLKVPHVGFNQVSFGHSKLYKGLDNKSDFYFTHSFRLQTDLYIGQATCEYGELFVASYERDNIAGVQFHPELSQTNGLTLLKNFIEVF